VAESMRTGSVAEECFVQYRIAAVSALSPMMHSVIRKTVRVSHPNRDTRGNQCQPLLW
jgi:hypothetical protein